MHCVLPSVSDRLPEKRLGWLLASSACQFGVHQMLPNFEHVHRRREVNEPGTSLYPVRTQIWCVFGVRYVGTHFPSNFDFDAESATQGIDIIISNEFSGQTAEED
jgi:hypothetical protein